MNTSRLNALFNIGLPTPVGPASVGDGYRGATEARLTVSQGLARRLGDALASAVASAVAYFRRGSVMAELHGMNDRELADVGLSRSNLACVFDADFAREHVRRGS